MAKPPSKPYGITVVGADVVRVDFYSSLVEPHFIAHVWTFEEVMQFAKELTTAALQARPRGKQAQKAAEQLAMDLTDKHTRKK